MFLISVTPFSQWMIFSLESKYKPLQAKQIESDSSVNILILGGGHAIAPDLPASGQLVSASLARLVEGIRIHKQIHGSRLICSGNSMSRRTTQAEMLANSAIELGVNANDTIQNRSPRNTSEEIHAYKERFGNRSPLIIVTSSYHMPRVQLLCEREGLILIPAPTDYYLKQDPLKSRFNFKPSVVKIHMFQSAIHEYVGMLKIRYFE
jgi:uncharacterized SAM-binding protein YcdF (DUF218 family)